MARASRATGELIDHGLKAGVIEKSGSWYSHDSQRIGQGRENAKRFLAENGEAAEAISRAIRQHAGLEEKDEAPPVAEVYTEGSVQGP